MRTLEIQPLSLLTGFGVAALAFGAMSQAPQATAPTTTGRTVEFFARPRDFVQIDEGTPFVVPAGKLFVPTAIGTRPPIMFSQNYELASLVVDGVVQLSSWKAIVSIATDIAGNATSMRGIPTGYAVPAGATVEVRDSNPALQDARVWGYLADA